MITARISGSTRLYAALGDPVAQVRAPVLLNPLLAELGVNAVVVPMHARPPELAGVVRALAGIGNVDGLLITIPHKMAVCVLADELAANAALCGTANVMRRGRDGRWLAENFDGLGFVRGLEVAHYPVRGMHAALVGAGGAGSAIAVGLLRAGVGRLTVDDLDRARLGALIHRLAPVWPQQISAASPGDLETADFVVNATPLGLHPGDSLPFDPRATRPDAVIADIVMEPHETALLSNAAVCGRRVHHGIHMLRGQVPYFRDFFGWPSDEGTNDALTSQGCG